MLINATINIDSRLFSSFLLGKSVENTGKIFIRIHFLENFFVLEVFGGWGSELEDFQEDRGVGD